MGRHPRSFKMGGRGEAPRRRGADLCLSVRTLRSPPVRPDNTYDNAAHMIAPAEAPARGHAKHLLVCCFGGFLSDLNRRHARRIDVKWRGLFAMAHQTPAR